MSFEQNGSLYPVETLPERLQASLTDAAHMIGQTLVRAAQTGITSPPKSGRHYPNLPNQSSAPGEYSANQSGDLLGSIDYRLEGPEYILFEAKSDHAGYQEYGTSKMGARPNLKKAIDESDGLIRDLINQLVMSALAGG